MSFISEDDVEQELIKKLQGLDYNFIDQETADPDGSQPERNSKSEYILLNRLKEAIERLNPEIPEDTRIDALKKLGYEAVPEVGVAGYFIDIGIKHPSYKYGYFAGIECDGRAYHSSLSARDNDIIRQKVLEGLGWNIYRIWSTDWYQDPNKELKTLDNYLKLRLRKK